ncbi:MAG: hypothetical protein DELT_03260 [Desulfovibrio sp.]
MQVARADRIANINHLQPRLGRLFHKFHIRLHVAGYDRIDRKLRPVKLLILHNYFPVPDFEQGCAFHNRHFMLVRMRAERLCLFQIEAFARHIHMDRFHLGRELRLFRHDRNFFSDGSQELCGICRGIMIAPYQNLFANLCHLAAAGVEFAIDFGAGQNLLKGNNRRYITKHRRNI